jgi:hypothetical protein
MAKEYSNVEAFIRKYGEEVANEMRTRLSNAGKVASGRLYRSIKFNIRQSVKELEASWRMADYGEYVDKGVEGAVSHKAGDGGKSEYKFGKGSKSKQKEKSLKSWMKLKGIPKEKYYPISRNIWMFGITPTNFFTIPTRRRQKQFEAGLEKAMVKDLDIMIEKQIK